MAGQLALEAFSSDRSGSPLGSPKGGDTSAMMDDLDLVRRETVSMGRTVQALSGRSVQIHLPP